MKSKINWSSHNVIFNKDVIWLTNWPKRKRKIAAWAISKMRVAESKKRIRKRFMILPADDPVANHILLKVIMYSCTSIGLLTDILRYKYMKKKVKQVKN